MSENNFFLLYRSSQHDEALIELHDSIMFYGIIVSMIVGWILVSVIMNYVAGKTTNGSFFHDYIENLVLNVGTVFTLILIIFLPFYLPYLIFYMEDPSLILLPNSDDEKDRYLYNDLYVDDDIGFVYHDMPELGSQIYDLKILEMEGSAQVSLMDNSEGNSSSRGYTNTGGSEGSNSLTSHANTGGSEDISKFRPDGSEMSSFEDVMPQDKSESYRNLLYENAKKVLHDKSLESGHYNKESKCTIGDVMREIRKSEDLFQDGTQAILNIREHLELRTKQFASKYTGDDEQVKKFCEVVNRKDSEFLKIHLASTGTEKNQRGFRVLNAIMDKNNKIIDD